MKYSVFLWLRQNYCCCLLFLLENVGLLNGANSRGDELAAAGPPGAVRVMDSCREIKLCREISGKAKTKSRTILFFVFFPSH